GIMVPTGVYWADKYNQTVRYTAERGFVVAAYMPVVPIAKIGKIFEEGEHDHDVGTNRDCVEVAQ
ncbi:hypothetical protein, partial [Vibrio vulnificus]|uniref:hypothetical protein n=1 Tax=Vibrio vulnificus TaxID=672 RepID=UPI001CCC4376